MFYKWRQRNGSAGAAKSGWVKDQNKTLRCGAMGVAGFTSLVQGWKPKLILLTTFYVQNVQEVELGLKVMILSQLNIPRFTMRIQTEKKQRRLVVQ